MRKRKLGSRVLLTLAFAILAVAIGLRSGIFFAAIPPQFFVVVDNGGPNDVAGQKDITMMGRWDDVPNNALDIFWSFDKINPSGQSFDACALFDANGNGNIDYAICANVNNGGDNTNPIPKLSAMPQVYKCNDTDAVHCVGYNTNPQPSVPSLQAGNLAGNFGGTADDLRTNTDPFSAGEDAPWDTTVRIRFNKSEIPAKLANVCTYPSASIDSAVASDCIANPGGGFLKIVKNVTGGDGTFVFEVSPVPSANSGGACDTGAPADCQTYSVTTTNLTGYTGLSLGIGTNNVTVKEHDQSPAYTFTNASCQIEGATPTSTGSLDAINHTINGVSIFADTITTCTFTNAKQPAKLTVTKVVNNDNGGTAKVSDYTLTVGNQSGDQTFTSGTQSTIPEGTYKVKESGPTAGYTATFSGNCDANGNITMVAGGVYTCTITNDDIAPKLTLSKIVVKDNGGTASASDFTLTATGLTSFSGTGSVTSGAGFKAGTYTLTESGPSGYSASAWSCDAGSLNGNQVTLNINQSATCTITNDDQPAKLIVKKHVINDNGGKLGAADFKLSVSDTKGGVSPSSFNGSETGTTVTLNAGTYSVSELPVVGYVSSMSADCTGTIGVGETKTCTVTNDDQQGTLTVVKTMVNDNGGTAKAGDFTLQVAATHASSTSVTGSEAPGVDVKIDAGAFSVTEAPGSAYTATFVGCSGTMTPGGKATCTVTNNDNAPTLIVKKHVINDNGGKLTAADFKLSVSDTNGGISPSSFNGSETGTTVTLNAGSYSVSEVSVTGYVASMSADCAGTIAAGEVKTCTVTNDDQQGTLTVIKTVVNDNGGNASAGDFTLQVSGGHASSTSVTGSTAGVPVKIDAGSFSVTETPGAAYAATFVGCTGTMTPGGTATCTVTNNDVPPKLTLVKKVTKNNGGTAVATDWTLTAAGPTTISGAGGATSTINPLFKTGTYTLSESTGPVGYTASDWSCVGGGSQSGNTITLSLGDNVTCTITNDDIPPKLTLIKQVLQGASNDPKASPSAFTVSANASVGSLSGPGAGITSGPTFQAGAYNLSESGPSGYTAGSWACTGGIQSGASQITLGIAQEATCVITNTLNNVPPSVSITKTVSPKNLDASGGPVTFTVTIKNNSIATDPISITPGTFIDTVQAGSPNIGGDLTGTCTPAAGQLTTLSNIPPGQSYACSWQVAYPAISSKTTYTDTDTVTVNACDDDNQTNSCVNPQASAMVTESMPIAITSGDCVIDSFTQIFTQDAAYHLTATNSGQLFYNLSIAGAPGSTKHMTLELPWPFVTQGSQPVQVYDSVSFANNCFGNYAGGYSIPNYTLLADYNVSLAERSGYPPVQPSLRTHRVELDVVIPATGFAFVRQHLDIGTKGPYVDFNGDLLNDDISYGKDAANDATDPANGRILIPQSFSHPFSVWGFKCSAVTDPGCDTSTDVTNTNISISGTVSITNDNQFQKVVGVYGLVKYDGISVPGMVVQLSQGSTILGVAITDASGVYSIAYKSKNKSDKYTVTLLNPTSNATVQSGGFGTISGMPGSTTKTVNIKNSDYVSVDFPLLH